MRVFKKIISVFFAVLFCAAITVTVSAENNRYFEITGPSSIKADEDFEVSVFAKHAGMYGVSGTVEYDPEKMEVVSVSPDLSGNWKFEYNIETDDGKILFAANDDGYSLATTDNFGLFTVSFHLIEETSEIKIKAANLEITDGKKTFDSDDIKWPEDNTGNNSYNEITINPGSSENSEILPENDPNNFYLKSLTVKNADIAPAFDKMVKEYNTTVPFETDSLEVEAVPENPKATVKISSTELKYVGKNIVKVVVLSESGLKRTYKIYATRKAPVKGNKTPGNKGLSLFWIIIMIAGALLIIAAAVFLIILISKRRKAKN